MPAGSTYQDFLKAVLSTVNTPDYYGVVEGEPAFVKFVTLPSGFLLLFQVKMKKNSKDISHAYPIVGQNVTAYNLKQEDPTPARIYPGILREELKRVYVRNQPH